jgi:hypothetical protein
MHDDDGALAGIRPTSRRNGAVRTLPVTNAARMTTERRIVAATVSRFIYRKN